MDGPRRRPRCLRTRSDWQSRADHQRVDSNRGLRGFRIDSGLLEILERLGSPIFVIPYRNEAEN